MSSATGCRRRCRLVSLFVLDAAVVGLVAEAVGVDRHQLAAVRHVIDDAVLDQRRRADALERPVVRAPRRQLVVHRLPHELAVRLAERHQDALVALDLGILVALVVGADEDQAVGDDRVAVGLRPELGHPLDVLLRLDVPGRRQPLHAREHVAVGRAAPHRPVGVGGSERAIRVREATDATIRRRVFSWTVSAFIVARGAPSRPWATHGCSARFARAVRASAADRIRESEPRAPSSLLTFLIHLDVVVVQLRAAARPAMGHRRRGRARPSGCRSDRCARSSRPPARSRPSARPCRARAPGRRPSICTSSFIVYQASGFHL